MIDSSNIPQTYATIVPATPNRRHPRKDAIATLYHVWGLGDVMLRVQTIKIKTKGAEHEKETKRERMKMKKKYAMRS